MTIADQFRVAPPPLRLRSVLPVVPRTPTFAPVAAVAPPPPRKHKHSGKLRAEGNGLPASRIGHLEVLELLEDGRVLTLCDHPHHMLPDDTRIFTEQELLSGQHSSCGCRATSNEDFAEYEAWKKRRARCNNPNHKQWADYGGRGIKHCARWEDFRTFFRDMGPRPTKQHQLDRINNDGPYSPDNCAWKLPVQNNAPGKRRLREAPAQRQSTGARPWRFSKDNQPRPKGNGIRRPQRTASRGLEPSPGYDTFGEIIEP